MNEIRSAFYKAYKKRTFLALMMVLPPVFLLSMRIAGYFLTTLESFVLTLIIIVLIILGRHLILRDSGFLKKKILKAFCKTDQYEEFTVTIDSELQSADAKVKTISDKKIFICMTATWFVLITPNGSLICKQCNIVKISSIFREADSKYSLKIKLSDKQALLFPYPDLEETLKEMT